MPPTPGPVRPLPPGLILLGFLLLAAAIGLRLLPQAGPSSDDPAPGLALLAAGVVGVAVGAVFWRDRKRAGAPRAWLIGLGLGFVAALAAWEAAVRVVA